MLRKVSIALSLAAALGLGLAIALPAASFAKLQEQNKQVVVKKNVNVNKNVNKNVFIKKNVNVNKNVQFKKTFVVGQKYNGHIWFGHRRHFWHGVWYNYGVGPCWINIEGEWFWNELACPL